MFNDLELLFLKFPTEKTWTNKYFFFAGAGAGAAKIGRFGARATNRGAAPPAPQRDNVRVVHRGG